MVQQNIRRAIAADSSRLTEISFSAKGYWKYPLEYMERWKQELTITPEYIEKHVVFACEMGGEVVAFYSLIDIKSDVNFGTIQMEKGMWLDHMFVLAEHIGKGIGSLLTKHMKEYLITLEIKQVLIFVDPNAQGFYDKMGAKLRRMSDSSIPGRQIPVYELEIAEAGYPFKYT